MIFAVTEKTSPARSWIALVLWSLAGATAVILDDRTTGGGHSRSQLLISGFTLVFGLWAFWQHGGRQITAAGVYSIASAVFVGFAGLYWWNYYGSQVPGTLFAATSACFFTHVVMYYCFWHREGLRGYVRPSDRNSMPVTQGGVTVGAVVTLASVLAAQRGLNISFTAPAAFAGVVMVAVALFARQRGPSGLGMWRVIAVSFGFALYARYVFSGFGRLNLAVLMLAIGMATCLSVRGRLVKLAGVAGTGPALLLFVAIRESFGQRINGSAGLSGVGSVVSPLELFSRLPAYVAHVGPSGGDTFWAAAVTQVPSQLWHEKPPGFGVVLAQIFAPQVVPFGGSLAALTHGEWVFDFGWLGLCFMVVVLGFAVRGADRWLRHALENPIRTRGDLVSRTGAVLLAAGMADLLWVGSQTFSSRTGTRLLVLLLILGAWAWRAPTQPKRKPSYGKRSIADKAGGWLVLEEGNPRHPG